MTDLHRVEGLITDITVEGTIANILVEPVANSWGASFRRFNTFNAYSATYDKYYSFAHFPVKTFADPIFIHEVDPETDNNIYVGTF